MSLFIEAHPRARAQAPNGQELYIHVSSVALSRLAVER
jgi:hypothetical protein